MTSRKILEGKTIFGNFENFEEESQRVIRKQAGKPRCWHHNCYLINLMPEEMIGQCPDSGYWWSYRHLDIKQKVRIEQPKSKTKIVIKNGELVEIEDTIGNGDGELQL